ncbi:phage protein NinX family protein [Providencia sp. PROV258]|uniref:phage protein NinX family protein n=1 Tax=Providencia sp. PROV258 TaxID=2949946 RepID=UPI002348F072|nr:phage protein NinX family protein [Providencia sp. PROV258]
MNKYTKLSDFEINKKVAEKLGLKFKDGVIVKNGEWFYFDPCNNPSDAWQLILEAKLSIHTDFNNDCESWIVRNIHIPMVNEAKLSRGISIAYLLMKDAENETNNKR